ncbi:hypothetical protein ACLGIH_27155 [Streptomyces sp. HMX87]|uniref:hypothetical protein n=1 Tax=Streptomyces sp. HMX87 TaxID=3390849 RepID=UPI003A8657D2
MSQLLAAAETIAPVITAVAGGVTGAVAQSAQNQMADGVVQRGREIVENFLARRSGDPEGNAETVAAVEEIERLTERDRLALDTAVGKWLDARFGDQPADLLTLIKQEAEAAEPAVPRSVTVNASGEGAVGIGVVHHLGGLHMGGRPRGESRGEPGESGR